MPHIHEKIDFTSEVFIVYKDKVLLRRHKKFDNAWLSIGGHIELDEDPNEAAIRETKEEVGLDVKLVGDLSWASVRDGKNRELIPPKFLNRHSVNPTHEHVTLVFFATSQTDKFIPEREDDEIKWFTKEKLGDPQYGIWEDIKHYAKAALDELGEK